ncbi:hypothetical protein NKH85_32160 [Mesorhizobium sp. M0924]|uniref:hypothetical protein n=1 Tax=unclassified Mesorhizobium TaxID=325217 RepID=UPI00333545FC
MVVRKVLARLPMPTTISAVCEASSLPGYWTVWEHPEGETSCEMDNVDRAFSAVMQPDTSDLAIETAF